MAYTMYPCPVFPHPTDTGVGDVHLPQLDGSEVRWVDDVMVDRTNSGAVKQRSLYPTKKKSFVVLHRIVPTANYAGTVYTAAQILAAYEVFYNNRRRLPFSFRWAGETTYAYTCVFAAPPRLRHTEMRIDMTVELLEI